MAWVHVLCFCIACYTILVSRIVYLLVFHPLAAYPGPFLARITDWYSVYHAWKGDRHLDFYRLHNRYGDVVRYGPNRISMNNVQALQAVYGIRANTQKSSFYSVFNHFFPYPSTETIIDKEQHAVKRRALAKALSEKKLQNLEVPFLVNVERFCSYLVDSPSGSEIGIAPVWSRPRDIAESMAHLSFDVMGDICFGRSFDMIEKLENRYLIEVTSDGAQGLNIVGHMPWLLTVRLHRLFFARLMQGLDQYKAYSRVLAEQCLGMSAHERSCNVFSQLLEQDKTGTKENSTLSELISESSLLVIAGSETISTTLANTVFHLLNNPSTLACLSREIRQRFTAIEDIRGPKILSSCKYLRACIDETLRLSPPVGGILPREVLTGGLSVCRHYFPQGTEIGVPIYTIHHSKAYFDEPFVFRPERWLATSSAPFDDNDDSYSAFFAFSTGPRSCIGKRMAYMELTTVIARMVWLYDMQLVSGSLQGDPEQSACERLRHRDATTVDKFVSKVHGPWVAFRHRRY